MHKGNTRDNSMFEGLIEGLEGEATEEEHQNANEAFDNILQKFNAIEVVDDIYSLVDFDSPLSLFQHAQK